jgi:hypothetical protein
MDLRIYKPRRDEWPQEEVELWVKHFLALANKNSVLLFDKKTKKPRKDTPLALAFWIGYNGMPLPEELDSTGFILAAHSAGKAHRSTEQCPVDTN